jgi:uncharacterized protein with beta-barrel porin domain
MKATMLSKRNSIGCALAFLGAFPAANALAAFPTIAGDVVSATFGEPSPSDGVSGGGTGTLVIDGSPPTTLSIVGQSFETGPDSAFTFADLTVSNGVANFVGTIAAPISFSVDFSSPGESNAEFPLTLRYEITSNDPDDVSDIIGIDEIGPVGEIEIDGTKYAVELLGFTDDGETFEELVVAEGDDAEAGLAAIFRIISPPKPPTPIGEALQSISTTPNTASTASAIAIACPASNERTPDSQFTSDCNVLVDGARSDEANTNAQSAAALSAITAQQATAPLSDSRASLRTQFQNLSTRLATLRGGATGISFRGLAINAPGQSAFDGELAGFPADPTSALGGGASADPGNFYSFGDGRIGVFVNGTISTGDKDPTTNEDGFDFDSWGITAGIDYRFRENLIAGIAGGYNSGSTDIDNSGGSLDTDGYSISVYGTYFHGESAYVEAIFSYGRTDYDQERNIRYLIEDVSVNQTTENVSVNQTASADYDGNQWSGAIGIGYDIPKGPWTFGPVARMQYVSADVDGYSERIAAPNAPGGGWAARLGDTDQDSFTTTLGGNVSRAFGTPWGVVLPQLHLSWVHEFEDDAIAVNGSFIEDPTGSIFEITSDKPDSDYFNARIAVSAQLARGNSAFIYYNKIFGYRDLDVDTLGAGLRLEF